MACTGHPFCQVQPWPTHTGQHLLNCRSYTGRWCGCLPAGPSAAGPSKAENVINKAMNRSEFEEDDQDLAEVDRFLSLNREVRIHGLAAGARHASHLEDALACTTPRRAWPLRACGWLPARFAQGGLPACVLGAHVAYSGAALCVACVGADKFCTARRAVYRSTSACGPRLQLPAPCSCAVAWPCNAKRHAASKIGGMHAPGGRYYLCMRRLLAPCTNACMR